MTILNSGRFDVIDSPVIMSSASKAVLSQIIKPKQIDTYSNENFWLSFTNHYQSKENYSH